MFEQLFTDNPLLAIFVGTLVLAGIAGFIRFMLLVYRAGVDRATSTPLIQAIKKGDLQECRKLLDEGADIDASTGVGNTPLTVACLKTNSGIVELLLSRGAKINQLGEYGHTPIMSAIQSGSESALNIVTYLVERGADVDVVDEKGATALSYAVAYDNMEVFDLLLNRVARPDLSAFVTAVSNDRTTMATRLLERGADANARLGSNLDARGNPKSALLLAVEVGNVDLVKSLIEHGADVNSEVGGLSPLQLGTSFLSRNKEIKKLLIAVAGRVGREGSSSVSGG